MDCRDNRLHVEDVKVHMQQLLVGIFVLQLLWRIYGQKQNQWFHFYNLLSSVKDLEPAIRI